MDTREWLAGTAQRAKRDREVCASLFLFSFVFRDSLVISFNYFQKEKEREDAAWLQRFASIRMVEISSFSFPAAQLSFAVVVCRDSTHPPPTGVE